MVCDGYLAGVVSWGGGGGCARPNNPSVFTDVAYFAPWIEAVRHDVSSVGKSAGPSVFQFRALWVNFIAIAIFLYYFK